MKTKDSASKLATDLERLDMDTMENTDSTSWSTNKKRNFDEMICPTDEELTEEIKNLEVCLSRINWFTL